MRVLQGIFFLGNHLKSIGSLMYKPKGKKRVGAKRRLSLFAFGRCAYCHIPSSLKIKKFDRQRRREDKEVQRNMKKCKGQKGKRT